ncbi:MAG: glutamyl-tRNA reductase, partial [Micrococcales bacterium]
MSVLVVGLSHRSAPLPVLEQAASLNGRAGQLSAALIQSDHIDEAAVLSTCNRLEVYAHVCAFHGALSDIASMLEQYTGLQVRGVAEHMYAHYGVQAVQHLFTVAAGLDSMAVGESQILGQVRDMYRYAQQEGIIGRELSPLLQDALRVGKRVHAQTDIDRAGPSLVTAGFAQAADLGIDLSRATVMLLGTGAMSALAATTADRTGVGAIVIAGRQPDRTARLAASCGATPVDQRDPRAVNDALADADIVVSCVGAPGYLIEPQTLRQARTGREHSMLFVDLGLPRDIDPACAQLPGVHVCDLADLGAALAGVSRQDATSAAQLIVDAEVTAWQLDRHAASVAPTVAALRARAQDVVDAELQRVKGRLGSVDPAVLDEVTTAVRRVADKLLHTPTVRVKSLTAQGGASYAEALRDLFDLNVDLNR